MTAAHISTALISSLRSTADQMRINAELPQKAMTRKEILLSQAERLNTLADELESQQKLHQLGMFEVQA